MRLLNAYMMLRCYFILGGSKNRNFTARNKIYMALGGGFF